MKRDARVIQSEKSIVEAGIRALIANPQATMSDIADAAGVGRNTLYRHFTTREALIRELTIICFEEFNEVAEPAKSLSGLAAIEAMFDSVIPIADRFQFLMSLWYVASQDPTVKRLQQRQLDEMSALIEQAKAGKEIASDLPTIWLVSMLDMTVGAAWGLIESGDLSATEAIDYAKRSFFNGCRI